MAKMGKPMLNLKGAVIANIESDDEAVSFYFFKFKKSKKNPDSV